MKLQIISHDLLPAEIKSKCSSTTFFFLTVLTIVIPSFLFIT